VIKTLHQTGAGNEDQIQGNGARRRRFALSLSCPIGTVRRMLSQPENDCFPELTSHS
jgi:hypothetical protein